MAKTSIYIQDMRSRRPTDTPLTLVEVSRWTLGPQRGLEELLALGRLDIDALRTLNSLTLLVHELFDGNVPPALAVEPVQQLSIKIERGEAVEEDEIIAAQQWLTRCTALLRQTKRLDYQAALNRLVLAAKAEQAAD